jgi:hypothetical protein
MLRLLSMGRAVPKSARLPGPCSPRDVPERRHCRGTCQSGTFRSASPFTPCNVYPPLPCEGRQCSRLARFRARNRKAPPLVGPRHPPGALGGIERRTLGGPHRLVPKMTIANATVPHGRRRHVIAHKPHRVPSDRDPASAVEARVDLMNAGASTVEARVRWLHSRAGFGRRVPPNASIPELVKLTDTVVLLNRTRLSFTRRVVTHHPFTRETDACPRHGLPTHA